MDNTLCPSGAGFGQLISHPASAFTTARTTGYGGPVEVARGVERNSFVRFTAIGASGETVENGMLPATADWRKLPDGATPKISAQNGRPIEIPLGIDRYIRVGVFTVIVTGKPIDHLGRARFHPPVKRDQQENGRAPNQAEEPPPLPNDRTRRAKIFTVRRSHDPPLAENSREEHHKKTVFQ
jgi:hypothetical protein